MDRQFAYEKLRRSGLRMTRLKAEIVDLFLDGGCGLSVKDVTAKLSVTPAVSTVYRCLTSLTEKGFLRHSTTPEGVLQYRCTDSFYPEHGHFVCLNCGKTIPLKSRLPRLFVLQLKTEYGVTVKESDFVVEGRCSRCQNT